jgi:DNA-binding transcriptional MerR regulator
MPAARLVVEIEELPLGERKHWRMPAVRSVLGVNAVTVRHWQREFAMWVRPAKSRSGHRLFSAHDVRMLWVIKHLMRTCGLSTDGARAVLGDGRWCFVPVGSLRSDAILSTAAEAAQDAHAAAAAHEAQP